MNEYTKAITAVTGAMVMAIASVITGGIQWPEWVMVAVAGWTAFQVFLTANVALPWWNYSKSITAGALAALGALGGYLANDGEMSTALWLNVAIAALTAAGVWKVNDSVTPKPATRYDEASW